MTWTWIDPSFVLAIHYQQIAEHVHTDECEISVGREITLCASLLND
jgi:hypothetical protein